MENMEQADRLDEIFRRVGAALWMMQSLETQSALYYLVKAKAEKGMGFQEGTKLLIQQNKKTFGNTLRSIESSNILPVDLQARFKHILKERNWLAHGSNIQGFKAIDSEQDTVLFIERLESIKEESKSLMKKLRELAVAYSLENGITEEDMQIGLERAKKAWFETEII
jgi:hypothetical protein